MDITLYDSLDPRRLMSGSFKSINDIAPVLGTPGEPISINSKTNSEYDGNINVYRNLKLTGKFKATFVLHGNINVDIQNADLLNAQGSIATIQLADNFTGNLSIDSSNIKLAPNTPSWAIVYESGGQNGRAKEVSINESTIDGIAVAIDTLKLSGNVRFNSHSPEDLSIINASNIKGDSAHLSSNYLQLINSGNEKAMIHTVEALSGPITFSGQWQIDCLVVNASSGTNMFVFSTIDGQLMHTAMHIRQIDIKKIPKGLSVFYSDNSRLYFDRSTLGNDNAKYNAAINDTKISMKQSNDFFNWVLSGNNKLDIDPQSRSSLQSRKNEFNKQQTPIPVAAANNNANSDSSDLDSLDSTDKANTAEAGMDHVKDVTEKNNMTKADYNNKKSITKADGLSRLKSMIGLKPVKATLSKFIAVAAMNQKREKMGLQQTKGAFMHMVFSGNPGTGKTTIAEIVAQIMHENGVLRTAKSVNATARNLISDHVGDTQQKTHDLIQSAIGGVLFIDEAYTLDSKGNSFADEAIGELLTGMVEYRDDMIIILGGYPKQMKHLIYKSNPGFRSRIGCWVDFPDYSQTELLQIFNLMCKQQGVLIDPRYLRSKQFKWLMQYFQLDHSNARDMALLLQNLYQTRDLRVWHKANPTKQELATVTSKDILTVYNDKQREWAKKVKEKKANEAKQKQKQANRLSDDSY